MRATSDDPVQLRADLDRIWSELERRLKLHFVLVEVDVACGRIAYDLVDKLMPRLHADQTTFKVAVLDKAGRLDPRMSATDLVAEFRADPAFASHFKGASR